MTMLEMIVSAAALATAPAHGQSAAAASSVSSRAYAPYDWLIGDWTGEAGPGVVRELLTYGPKRSYIKFSVFTGPVGGPQSLHFEGIAVWNARTKLLDYLFAVEPGSGVQEQGTIRVEPDGTVVREVEFTDAAGKTGTFRQTFRRTGADSAVTTVMRKTATGWEPTFPGGERILLTRRRGSATVRPG